MKIKIVKKVNYNIMDILSIVILLLCVPIPFFSRYIKGQMFISLIRCFIIFLILFQMKMKNKMISKGCSLMLMYLALMVATSAFNKCDMSYVIKQVSCIILISVYLELFNQKYMRVLRIWGDILFIFVIIDALSMIAFPQGMYADSLYTTNWFLGYKTARLVFCLPLCVYQALLSQEKYGKYTFKSIFCMILSVLTLVYSKAMAAGVALAMFVLILFVLNSELKIFRKKRLFNYLFNIQFILPLYVVVAWATITISKNYIIQYIVINYFGKDATLTTRTNIWKRCLDVILKSPWFGNGCMKANQYVQITGNPYATSAHSMPLSILVTTGIVGMVMYMCIIWYTAHINNKNRSQQELILLDGVVASLIVGITSSAIVYSASGFVLFALLSLTKNGEKYGEKNKTIFIKKYKKN